MNRQLSHPTRPAGPLRSQYRAVSARLGAAAMIGVAAAATWVACASPAHATTVNAPPVAVAGTPTGDGYWLASSDGGVFAFGDAGFHGSMGGQTLNALIVGIAATPDGNGYWEVASDGGIFAFGDAAFYGSMGGQPLNKPVVGIAATRDGKGYWEVASDGGIFAFGDAGFHGSMGGQTLNAPIVSIAGTPDNGGYWEVASDGGIFAFGDAGFHGSMGGQTLNAPVIGIAATPDGKGYWEVASDGGIFAFGDASYYGSVRYTAPGGPGTPVTPGAEETYAYSLFAGYGWGTDQQTYLYQLWYRESGWNAEADNSSSHAYGIPQSLPSKPGTAPYPVAYAAANPQKFGGTSDPDTQIRWGEAYISGRYTNPQKAWNHEKADGWY